jgi:hypothetical protein
MKGKESKEWPTSKHRNICQSLIILFVQELDQNKVDLILKIKLIKSSLASANKISPVDLILTTFTDISAFVCHFSHLTHMIF